MKHPLRFIFFAIIISSKLFAQDDQFYSVFSSNNNRWINPSSTDFEGNFLSANLTSKYQTKNIGGDMSAGVFDISIKTKNRKNCFGFVYCLDKTSYQKVNSFYFNYSYSIIFHKSKLNFGTAIGIVKQTSYDDELNMILPGADLPSGTFGSGVYDINVGAKYIRKNLSLSVSANHSPQPEFHYNLNPNQNITTFLSRAFYFQAQYKLPINEGLSLNILGLLRLQHPQSLTYTHITSSPYGYYDSYSFCRNNSSTTLFTIGGEMLAAKKYIFGVSYAGSGSEINNFGLEIGCRLKNLRMCINYFLPNSIRGNAIEISLRFII